MAVTLGVHIGRSTLLRLVRALPDPSPNTVEVLGVDDFALRRRHRYGRRVGRYRYPPTCRGPPGSASGHRGRVADDAPGNPGDLPRSRRRVRRGGPCWCTGRDRGRRPLARVAQPGRGGGETVAAHHSSTGPQLPATNGPASSIPRRSAASPDSVKDCAPNTASSSRSTPRSPAAGTEEPNDVAIYRRGRRNRARRPARRPSSTPAGTIAARTWTCKTAQPAQRRERQGTHAMADHDGPRRGRPNRSRPSDPTPTSPLPQPDTSAPTWAPGVQHRRPSRAQATQDVLDLAAFLGKVETARRQGRVVPTPQPMRDVLGAFRGLPAAQTTIQILAAAAAAAATARHVGAGSAAAPANGRRWRRTTLRDSRPYARSSAGKTRRGMRPRRCPRAGAATHHHTRPGRGGDGSASVRRGSSARPELRRSRKPASV